MQNRYVGDIGDYVKYALLRCILRAEGGQLGIAWYLYPDEVNGDGGHTEYLDHPKSESWKRLDDQLFGKLKALVDAGERSIFAIQRDSEILGSNTRFCADPSHAEIIGLPPSESDFSMLVGDLIAECVIAMHAAVVQPDLT
ncbi:MAG: hypothetical protein F4053_00440 [Proteobacteria bacterium]|nr:hypothetical protein [Pseudomonadota bacterium]MYJ94105.1 hypothetical protein [Pseudomonadota bacterium]